MSIDKLFDEIQDDLIDFTQRLIRVESYTGKEIETSRLVKEEMLKLGYDDVIIDKYGSVLGKLGSGDKHILYDGHIDVVEASDKDEWLYPPFEAKIVDGKLYGRGAVDMKGAVAGMVYAGYAMKKLNLLEGKTVYISASVMEEDYDGELLYRVINEQKLSLDYTIIGEPSALQLAVGHRGRAMYVISTPGISAHGSAPEKGDNAIYKMGKILHNIEQLQKHFDTLEGDNKGSIVVSDIKARTASLNAIPDLCSIYIDRRLALGETREMVDKEMDKIIEGTDASWEIYTASGKSFTNVDVELETFLPAWEINLDHELVKFGQSAFKEITNSAVNIFKWPFATNGFATNGRFNVPTIGFGPGDYKLAHMKDEHCAVNDIVLASKFYTTLVKHI